MREQVYLITTEKKRYWNKISIVFNDTARLLATCVPVASEPNLKVYLIYHNGNFCFAYTTTKQTIPLITDIFDNLLHWEMDGSGNCKITLNTALF